MVHSLLVAVGLPVGAKQVVYNWFLELFHLKHLPVYLLENNAVRALILLKQFISGTDCNDEHKLTVKNKLEKLNLAAELCHKIE